MTFRQWIENFWYHYKWHTIIALFLALTLAVGVTQCATRVKYDQNCILYCDRVIPDNTAAALELELTGLVPDRDGNGEALLEVYNVSYDSDGTGAGQAAFSNSQKIMALVSTADYVLYVVDEYGYDRLMNQDNMNLFETYDFLPDKDGTAWNWKGSSLHEKFDNSILPDNLYFCIRKVAGTSAQGDEGAIRRAEWAAQLVRSLMAQ